MGSRQWAVGSGPWTVGCGQWAVDTDSGPLTVGHWQWVLDSGQWTVDSGQSPNGQWTVGCGSGEKKEILKRGARGWVRVCNGPLPTMQPPSNHTLAMTASSPPPQHL